MPKERSKLQLKLEYFAVRGLFGAVGLFPLKTSISLGAKLGRFINALFPRLRKNGRRSLEIAFPEMSEAEKEQILRGTFENMGRQLGFISHSEEFEAESFRRLVDAEGLQHLKEAAGTGRGIILFTGHFGGWEISSLATSAYGYNINVIVRRIDNPLIEKFVDKFRTKFGAQTIDKKSSARTMLRVLQKGGTLGILNDLNSQEHEGVFVDFFDVPASTASGLAKLALRTDAVILPLFAIWQAEKQKYLFKVDAPVEFEKSGDDERDVRELTQKVSDSAEKYIRQYPDQWLWIHKRWNTRPAGEKELY